MSKEGTMHIDSPHLGGYIEGGDDATYYPDLWRWLVKYHRIRTVLDVGCGEGHAIPIFEKAIMEIAVANKDSRDFVGGVRGVDGVRQQDWRIYEHDYTLGPFGIDEVMAPTPEWGKHPGAMRWMGSSTFDLVWCCEFVEHVEERFMGNFLETFKLAPLILMTHADPGQPGWHHVNCRNQDYWEGVLAATGYHLDIAMTATSRKLAAKNTSPWNHFVRSGLAFRRHP